ncbi:MAG: FtsQ-type POTRA domain-containing protein [Acidobacteriota bacterium]|nr:FtsQ-type POTRA domain-containing protein [Acidobacteriota bacterium]
MAARRRLLAIAIVAPIVLVGAYFAARETSMFAVRTIAVSGGTPAVQSQVRAALAPLLGRSLLALDGGALERRVDALPTVVSTTYDRAFPHTLRVRIVPEVAVAVLHRGNEAWLVSGRGRAIRQIRAGTQLGLPRIWVPTAAQVAAGGFLAPDAGGTAARALALAAGFPARFTTVSFAHGELTMELRVGVELRLGEPVDVRLKLAIARRALRVLPPGSTYLAVAVPQRPVAGTNSQLSTSASSLSG